MDGQDLKGFGKQLRRLRRESGLTQVDLANRLSQIHTEHSTEPDLGIDGNLISKWERAFQGKGQRVWRPKLDYVVYLITIFAEHLTLEKARHWVTQVGYTLTPNQWTALFPDDIDEADIDEIEATTPEADRPIPPPTASALLDQFPEQSLFGVSTAQQEIAEIIQMRGEPWLIAIDGLGGLGKTTLANAIMRQVITAGQFQDVVWLSAKQEEFLASAGIQAIDQPALDTNTLIDFLLEKLGQGMPLPAAPKERQILLSDLIKQAAYFIVIDNLETVADYQTLLPLLRQLANPTKFLLTTRQSLYAYDDVFSFSLSELDQPDAFALLRHEAKLRGLSAMAQATDEQLDKIYGVVGGSPLALKLVVGQTKVLPLSQVLDSLREAEGQKVDDLFTYIYWQSWHALTPPSRQALLAMPMISGQGGTFDHLLRVSRLEADQLREALTQLTAVSLLEIGGDLEERRYRIHRLTETFLMKEVIKWSPSG